MTTIVVTSRSFGSGTVDVMAEMAGAGLTVIRGDVRHDPVALQDVMAQASGWIAGASPITAQLLDLAPNLRVVARYGVGTDAVDLAACADRGITVTNTPGANTDSVAELALTLILGLLRRTVAANRAVRAGDWSTLRGQEIADLTVGVYGFGRIGRAFAQRVIALGASVTIFDPYLPMDLELPSNMRRTFKAVELADCDAVSLHADHSGPLITAGWLARAHRLTLVNTARAHLIDEVAVATALADGRLAGYAADTLADEFDAEAASPLLAPELADHVILTPHIGAQTAQAIDRMGQMAVTNVIAVLAGDPPPNPVSKPSGAAPMC